MSGEETKDVYRGDELEEDFGREYWEKKMDLGVVHLWEELQTWDNGNSQESIWVTLDKTPSFDWEIVCEHWRSIPQLVLHRSIKMLAANGWEEEVGIPGSHRQATRFRRWKGISLALKGERNTSHMRSQVEWSLAASQTGPGVAGGRLETQLSWGQL